MINSNISSLQAHQKWMNNNAKNIANINTSSYIPINTTITQDSNNLIKTNNSLQTTQQTNLTKEIPEQINIQTGYAVNISAIKTQNEMLGTLLDIKT